MVLIGTMRDVLIIILSAFIWQDEVFSPKGLG